MSKVTSKLQGTLPKKIAEQYQIRPGQEIEFAPSVDTLRVILPGVRAAVLTARERLDLFDQATAHQRTRQRSARRNGGRARSRGWKRAALHDRASPH